MDESGGIAIFIALLSAGGAAFSAAYAKHASKSAKRANEISLHHERLKIYKALLNLRSALQASGLTFRESKLFAFSDAVELSEFYFDAAEHEALKKVLDDASKIKANVASFDGFEDSEKLNALRKETNELFYATRDRCTEVADKLKPALSIGSLE